MCGLSDVFVGRITSNEGGPSMMIHSIACYDIQSEQLRCSHPNKSRLSLNIAALVNNYPCFIASHSTA